MAPTRKSMSFLTLRPNRNKNADKDKENSFLYRLSDFSTTINRRRSMRNMNLPNSAAKTLTVSRKLENKLAKNICETIRMFLSNAFHSQH